MAAAQGSFRGRVIGRTDPNSHRQWIYLAAGRGAIRRVDIGSAAVRYAKNIPEKRRPSHPADALAKGAEVEVQAVQDDSGEWKASTVRILALAGE